VFVCDLFGVAMGTDMSHSQFIMGDILTGGFFQIGDQIRQEKILQFATFLADQMTVRHGIAVKTVRLSRNSQASNLPVGSQLIEVTVYRTHGDVGHFFTGTEKHLLSSQMIADIGQNIADQRLLLGHLFTSFRFKNNS